MKFKMIFINICVAIVVFSLFLLFFLKPKFGPQFEVIKPVEKTTKQQVKVTPTAFPTPTPKSK